ncbi:MAG: AAA family ATPase [Deferribacteres bacterium]|nr:AAA family ATPase [candidate division KSB1 bacterium]MCB9501565.1 AAA family ATPase [Deferribacteres bacterium]
MKKLTVVLITGHPATGKTTLAHALAKTLKLPLIWKDQFKESLFDTLGVSTPDWSDQLSTASWNLLYLQVENLLKANISHIVEGNFNPVRANERWQSLKMNYAFQIIQVRCETKPDILLERYRWRIKNGIWHHGHVDASNDNKFLEAIQQDMEWVDVQSIRLSCDTSPENKDCNTEIVKKIRKLTLNEMENRA